MVNSLDTPDLHGVYTITIRDGSTLEVKDTITVDNNISYTNAGNLAAWEFNQYNYYTLQGIYNSRFSECNISISTNSLDLGRNIAYIPYVIGTSRTDTVNVGPFYTVIDSTGPGVPVIVQIKQRMQSTESVYGVGNGYSRTFSTICMSIGLNPTVDFCGSLANYTSLTNAQTATIFSYAVLTTPCTQAASDIIDFTYSIQIPLSVYYKYSIDLANTYIVGGGYESAATPTNTTVSWPMNTTPGYPVLNPISVRDSNVYPDRTGTSWSYTSNSLLFSHNKLSFFNNYNSASTSNLGAIVNGITYGGYKFRPAVYNTSSMQGPSNKIQSIFSHGVNATVPFLDNNNLATGSIKPVLSGTTATTQPYIYMYKIASTGAIGTSTYKIFRKRTMGLSGNTWTDLYSSIPYLPVTTSNGQANVTVANPIVLNTIPNFHGYADLRARYIKYSSTQVMSYTWNGAGVTVLDLFSGAYTNYDSTTSPALNATNIGQCHLDATNNLIYIACRSTGLYVLNLTTLAISNVNSLPCLGVTGVNTSTYALFNNSGTLVLAKNSGWTTYLGFTLPFTSLQSGDQNSVFYIKGDPNPSPAGGLDRLAVVALGTSEKMTIYWWVSGTSAVVSGPNAFGLWATDHGADITPSNYWALTTWNLHHLVTNPECFKCNTDSVWLAGQVVDPTDRNVGSIYYFAMLFGSLDSDYNTIKYTQLDSSGTGHIDHPFIILNEYGHLVANNATWYIVPSTLQYVNSQVYSTSNRGLTAANWNIDYYACKPASMVYMGNGMVFSPNYLQFFGNLFITTSGAASTVNTAGAILNPMLWEYYSWSGTAWQKDAVTWNSTSNTWVVPTTSAKTTHTSVDTLGIIDSNLSLAITELGSTGAISGEYYTQFVCSGVVKDQSTNVTLKSSFYLAPTNIVTGDTALVVPSSAPYTVQVAKSPYSGSSSKDSTFYIMETDDLVNHTFSIAGYSQPATLLSDLAIAPGANQILINGSTGTLIFSSVDAGKTVTPTQYFYVSGDTAKTIPSISTFPAPLNSIKQPTLLLDGGLGVTSSSGSVSAWSDTYLSINSFTQPTISLEPTLGTQNSRATIAFNGTTQYLSSSISPITFAQGYTLFLAFKPASTSANGALIYICNPNIANTGISIYNNQTNGTLIHYLGNGNKTIFSGGYNLVTNTSSVITGWNLATITSTKDSRVIIRLNGVTQLDTTHPATQIPGAQLTNIALGAGFNSNGTNGGYWSGQMSYVGIYNNYLTVSEIQSIEGYIRTLYNLY